MVMMLINLGGSALAPELVVRAPMRDKNLKIPPTLPYPED